ncbi:MAG: endonuclease [Rhodospirillaceae bacterium]|nr:endonuclease [Rhodospirillaceae bacterium]HAA91135.1 sugar phosphate isomerase/epimerase [Rhodospirillaceae bacterium]
MRIRDRIGIDIGAKMPVEQGIDWAHRHEVRYIDFRIDTSPVSFDEMTPARCAAIKDTLAETGIAMGLHTLSAVNIAEFSPHLSEAADAYLRSYIDIAKATGAGWVEIHAGLHFTDDKVQRMGASLERIKRTVGYAEEKDVTLLLENLNWEPDHAEVHYLAHNLEECHFYFDAIDSPHLRWAFTINHADLLPVGIDGFIDGMDLSRCDEVRVADSHGEYEEHLPPGEGRIDWQHAFDLLENHPEFDAHYMCAFGSLEVMLQGREYLAKEAETALRKSKSKPV